jgi:xanthine dehydrogenase YagS FAD-binding subunit
MFVAGGTDLLQLLREFVVTPTELIDLNGLPFSGIDVVSGGLRIGALTRLADLADDPRIRRDYPLLARALDETASPQVRNMATVGGNLLQRTRCLYFRDAASPCNKRAPGSGCPAMVGRNRMNAILGGSEHCIAAYPGDMAVALLALGAELSVQAVDGERRMKLADLHREPGNTPEAETSLRPGDIITAVVLPAKSFAAHSHFLKLRDRASFEWALMSVAAALDLDGAIVREARIAVGGVATRPWRLQQVEGMLVGQTLDEEKARAAGDAAADGAAPKAGNAFKVPLLRRAVTRAILAAGGVA